MREDPTGATVEKECNGDVAGVRLIHMRDQVRQEWILITLNQPLLVTVLSYSAGEVIRFRWYDMSNSSARVIYIA